ncbi:ribosomal protein S10 domain-containing protein [Leucosporidium creatinivorum]|uniref:Ribosomal protein S10 domain-containing protein n=1 Tax=Leucosporidium creatinivorum TaxID=106004 RepID=A0A1Y2FN57_9BASI|nr:ribosomal protein S10 domain-containing protein [Leucosporidium creatinivorum]
MSLSTVQRSFARLGLGARSLATQPAPAAAPSTSSTSPSRSELPPTITPSSTTPPTSASSPAPSAALSPSVAGQHLPTPALSPHTPIPPKHSIHVATLHLRSHTSSLPQLTFFTSFALRSARALGLPTSGAISLPTKTSLFTTPRSPFAHKKSQQNFWRKEHKRAIKVWDGNEEVVTAWLAYLRKEAMGGVGMKAQVFEYREVGWGAKLVEEGNLRTEAVDGGEEAVRALAKELEGELKEGLEEGEKVEQEIKLAQGEREKKVLEETTEAEGKPEDK